MSVPERLNGYTMYRLLLPGIRLKRWVLVILAGMLVFALGFTLLMNPQLDVEAAMWRTWEHLSRRPMPESLLTLFGLLSLIAGVVLVSIGTRRLIRAFTTVANPHTTGRQLLRTIIEERQAAPKLRIVGLGGGTGLSTLLRGLKAYPVDLTAIVTVSDDGGSSGRLREDLHMPPPGDIRSCLVALADAEPLMEQLFQHRFPLGAGELDGHSLGNLIIAAMRDITGDFERAVQEVSRVLAVRGRVLPSANRALVLKATMADGAVVYGETAIVAHQRAIISIGIEPPDVPALPEALQAIREADVIILGPGSVYSSLLPNLLIPGMAKAVAESTAIKFFICNVMTQPGESDQFSAARHLQVVVEHLPVENPFKYAIVNMQRPSDEVLASYAENGQQFVEPDLDRLVALGTTPVTDTLLAEAHLARHAPDKLARCLLQVVAEETGMYGVLHK